ncbi:hypothetical protein [Agromyces humatus]|uniref:Uncharacterized protein n=1 Tax=Agromyces humatus TaxID=279573 RepID=A0ABN2L3L8_9MICO|nr:hypothetical protein [Agromyces humatus]
MLLALFVVLVLLALAAAYAGIVALGARVRRIPFDPGYDSRRPVP